MTDFSEKQMDIINVSLDIISESGIQNLTIKNIAKKLNRVESAIYRHFSSKYKILSSIVELFGEEIKKTLEIIDLEEKNEFKKIKTLFISRCNLFNNNQSIANIIFSEEIFKNENDLSKKFMDIMNKTEQFLVQNLTKSQNKSEIRNDIDPKSLSLIIMGTLRLLITRWRLNKSKFDLLEEAEKNWQSLEKLITKEN